MPGTTKHLSEIEVERELVRQLSLLEFSTIEITPYEDFKTMLKKSIETNRPLRVKLGIDPTSVDVHIGHMVTFKKMRQFQDLGHIGVVIIGDYTARIGDPTGKNETRPPLTVEQVNENAKRYMEQVYTVLDQTRTEIHYQTEWFKTVDLSDVLRWAAQTTVAKLVSHDTFKKRLEEGAALGLHEFFYPVLQGMDSVYIKADVELGGSDQKFNVLMGRDYQKHAGLRPQVALLLPILTGLCGTQKMSKSLGNYIGVLDAPFDKFGKVMSIPDSLMPNYAQYATNFTPEQFKQFVQELEQGKLHPNEAKKILATEVVSIYHGKEVAKEMRMQFEAVFAKGKIPDDAPEYKVGVEKTLLAILNETKLVESNSEARRLFSQNAVSFVDGDKITEPNTIVDQSWAQKAIKIGKRKFLKFV